MKSPTEGKALGAAIGGLSGYLHVIDRRADDSEQLSLGDKAEVGAQISLKSATLLERCAGLQEQRSCEYS